MVEVVIVGDQVREPVALHQHYHNRIVCEQAVAARTLGRLI